MEQWQVTEANTRFPSHLLLEQRGLFTALFKAEGSEMRILGTLRHGSSLHRCTGRKGSKLPFAHVNEAWRAAGNAISNTACSAMFVQNARGFERFFTTWQHVFINLKQMLQVVDDCRIKLSNVKQVVFQTRSLSRMYRFDDQPSCVVESPPGVQKIINHSPVVSPNVEQT